MKQSWKKLQQKIDALSIRERAMLFMMIVVVFLALVNALLLDPQFSKQKQLSAQIHEEQDKIAAIQSDIQKKAQLQQIDPDAANRKQRADLQHQYTQIQQALIAKQKELVPPEHMAAMLEDILKRNTRLHVVSIKTLPVYSVTETPPVNAASTEKKPEPTTLPVKPNAPSDFSAVYKHGIEIVVEGNYADMLAYLTELETRPWQLFWNKVKMEVQDYPKTTLTLTLFTLSLDKKWLNL
jgi:MSHA biogenesis protein MshJ